MRYGRSCFVQKEGLDVMAMEGEGNIAKGRTGPSSKAGPG